MAMGSMELNVNGTYVRGQSRGCIILNNISLKTYIFIRMLLQNNEIYRSFFLMFSGTPWNIFNRIKIVQSFQHIQLHKICTEQPQEDIVYVCIFTMGTMGNHFVACILNMGNHFVACILIMRKPFCCMYFDYGKPFSRMYFDYEKTILSHVFWLWKTIFLHVF